MKYLLLLLLLIPTLGFSQHELNEGNNYAKPTTQFRDPDLKKFDHLEQLEILENKQQSAKQDPHLAGEAAGYSHFDPEMIFAEPEYRKHTVYVLRGKGHYEYTATECNKDCSSEKWTPEILKEFRSYIEYLGLTEEEFVLRYILSSFYNPQE